MNADENESRRDGVRPMAEPLELWRVKRVAKETTVSVATIWRWSSDGRFPCPRRLGAAAVAWRSDEVREWMETRPQVQIRKEAGSK